MPLSVTCPGCRETLAVDDEYRTWKVRCPRCDAEFVPDGRAAGRAADLLPRRVREEDDDYDDRPRRRRFTRDVYDQAAMIAHGPGVALEVVGWLGVLGTLAVIALFVMMGAAAGGPGGPRNADGPILMMFGVCIGVFGLPYSLILTTGGRHLRRLSSQGWATAAGCLALGGFVLFGFFGVFHLAVGVWAMVAINKTEVKAAFNYHARHGGPPPDGSDYDDED